MNADTRNQVLAGVATAVATAAVLGVAGVVTRQPVNDKELSQLHTDVARVEARCERIENLLLERK